MDSYRTMLMMTNVADETITATAEAETFLRGYF